MSIRLLIFCFLGLFLNPGGNEKKPSIPPTFDKEVKELYFELFSMDSDEAFKAADSLYQHTDDPLRKAGARMLGANILGKEGQHLRAIQYAKQAIKAAKEINNYSLQIFMWQGLVQFYAEHGFYDKAEGALKQGNALVAKLKSKKRIIYYKGMMIKAQGHLSSARGKNKEAIESFEEALRNFSTPEHPDAAFRTSLARTYQLLGAARVREGNLQKALEAYYAAQHYIEISTSLDARYAGLIYEGLANVYLLENKIDSARVYLQRGMEIAHSNALRDFGFTERIYKGWVEYYHQTHQADSLDYYHHAYAKIVRQRKVQDRVMVNEIMHYILQEEKAAGHQHTAGDDTRKEEKKERAGIWWILGGIGILGVTILVYKRIIFHFESPDSEWVIAEVEASDSSYPISREKPISLPESAVINLSEKLQEFEEEMRFLDPEMSYPNMAGILETNTKYLNVFLSTYLQTNYIAYINDKRIDYILNELREDPKSRTYKLTHLAEKAGFSSYSAFANNFKRYTGESPSTYVKSLFN